jgi:trigger factor
MKSSVEPLEGNKVKLYVEVDEAEFDRDIDQAFKSIAREVKLPGFRNGKAPRRVLEARIGLGPAREQALRDAIPRYLGKAVREHDVDLIATPQIEVTGGQDEGMVEFEAECEVRPEIAIPGYGGLRIELDPIDPTDAEVEEAQQLELRGAGSLDDVDRPAQAGDFLTIDIAATRDGEEVAGLNTEDFSYELGKGWVTDDFDEHLTGASVGDVLTFSSKPKGTEVEADFTVTVKAVQELIAAEATDDWVSENVGEFDTVEEWTQSIRERLAEAKLAQVRQTVMPKLTEALTNLVDVEPPASMVDAEMQSRLQTIARQFQAQGIDFGAWLSATGQDPREFMEGSRPQAEQAVKADLALRAVAAAEDIDVSDDELDMEYSRMAMQFGQKARDIRRMYEQNDAVPELIAQIKKSKATDWLLHHVEMVDTSGTVIDRDLVLGHTHDHDHDHDHDHEHDHEHDEDDDVISAGEGSASDEPEAAREGSAADDESAISADDEPAMRKDAE